MFSKIVKIPIDPVYALMASYREDISAEKVDLGVGVYRDKRGHVYTLPVIANAIHELNTESNFDYNYLHELGLNDFTQFTLKLALGSSNCAILERRAAAIQALGGTGAFALGAKFLFQAGFTTCYVSNPTWPNHEFVFKSVGFSDIRQYRYGNVSNCNNVDFAGMMEDLNDAPEKSIVVLQVCCHNPTGCDLTFSQWKAVARLVKEKKLFPFFDLAYQGFSSGNLDQDSWCLRYFSEQQIELFCAQSLSKTFTLYGERCGSLIIVVRDSATLENVVPHISPIIRSFYCNPPSHGARIIAKVLNSPRLYNEFKENIASIAERLAKVRLLLKTSLIKHQTPGNWKNLTSQNGMFFLTGFDSHQVTFLRDKYHIYVAQNGRINLCGINEHNIAYVTKAFQDTVLQHIRSEINSTI